MSEYVCCDFDLAEGIDCRELEQIVRCRDCKSMQGDSDYYFCMLAARELESADGYCAWAERRDA